MIDIVEFLNECEIDILHIERSLERGVSKYHSSTQQFIRTDAGATKFVFLGEETDNYVFKIPTCPKDYCSIEVDFYQKAKDYGIVEVFAETTFFTVVNSLKIYKQSKVDMSYCKMRDTTGRRCYTNLEKKVVYDLFRKHNFALDCENWLYDVLDYYGEEFAEKVILFFKKCKINDLHSQNVGYVGNRPIVFDYSGYYGCN